MLTKPVTQVKLNSNYIKSNILELRGAEAKKQILNVHNNIIEIINELEQILLKNKNFIKIINRNVYFNNLVCGIFPNLTTFELGKSQTYFQYDQETFRNKFEGFTGELMTENEFSRAFAYKLDFYHSEFKWRIYDRYTISGSNYTVNQSGSNSRRWAEYTGSYYSYHIPIVRLSNEDAKMVEKGELIYVMLKNHLIPDGLSQNAEKNYKKLLTLYLINPNYFILAKQKLSINEEVIIQDVNNGILTGISDDDSLILDRFKQNLLSQSEIIYRSAEIQELVLKHLLNTDKKRADLDKYDEKILTDPNRGHWELWESENIFKESDDKVSEGENSEENTNGFIATLEMPLIARNPIADIKHDGVIGIDFGTKSTVVVFQEASEHTMLMRIGTGRLSKDIEESHYENPTVMELIDINSFLHDYNMKQGRPLTSWEDITTSHTAFNSFINSGSDQYYSYIFELKKWIGDRNRQIRLNDKKGTSLILPAYTDIKEGELDPIELYAYYIGLYINNMHNGIYLDYILSYPVSYEKLVRDKMVESFRRGIKKSLPVTVLNDKKIMEKFRVNIGATEPVSYALCALEEYGFIDNSSKNENIYYGVFDFGGGTTDFDFGIFREAKENEKRYDYVIESFGFGGDKYLGGENILELLAFEVFKSNQDQLRKSNISFTLPPECKRFLGSEVLLSDAQEAKINMAHLQEKLRAFWERTEGYQEKFDKGVIKVSLFNNFGEQLLNYELNIDPVELEKIIYNRIEKGVKNFFSLLVDAFDLHNNDKIKNINILLAGNSCKSEITLEIFNKYIEETASFICSNKEVWAENLFCIYPPLGTTEAIKIQTDRNIEVSSLNLERPTGKTGVAFGLLKSRQGGKIKLITEKHKDEEIKFSYYLGEERKRKFKALTNRDIEYFKWFNFIDASEEDFSIFYTSLAECMQGELSISDVSRKNCRIDIIDANANVYIRVISSSAIEYVVAFEDEIDNGNYLSTIKKIELNE